MDSTRRAGPPGALARRAQGPAAHPVVDGQFIPRNAGVIETARDAVFGTGGYPTAPTATFNQITAVGDPRGWQFELRLRF